MTELRKGRPSFMLTKDEQEQLRKILYDNKLTVEQAAKQAKISYRKFYLPMSGANGCSRESYKSIQRFLKKYSEVK